MILEQVRRTIREHDLFKQGEHVLVCVSGGADSVALLIALHELAPELGIRLAVAHLNHQIRGPAADEDEQFVRAIAGRLGIDVVTERKNVKRIARLRGQSLETAGREVRYEFFEHAARKHGCNAAATGHTADDQAETILLRLARGTGIRGLCGIPRSTILKKLKIVRPLLDASRKNIIRFLEKRGQTWREDASNENVSFLRNRVRHEIIPRLESRLNPQLPRALLRLADIMEEENEWIDSLALNILQECCVPREQHAGPAPSGTSQDKVRKSLPYSRRAGKGKTDILCERLIAYPCALRKRVLRQWLGLSGVPQKSLDFEMTGRLDRLLVSGRTACSATPAGGWIVRRNYGRLAAEKGKAIIPTAYSERVEIPGETLLPEQGFRIAASIESGICREKPAAICALPSRASLNPAAWRRRRIIVRSWRPGDRMSPFGMKGSKKIQDIFVDAKTPGDLRHSAPIFECHGEIIWLPGFRIARGWAVPEDNVRALQLRIERI